MTKRGICANCGHARWLHFDQYTEIVNQKIGKCSVCPCQKYSQPQIGGYLFSENKLMTRKEYILSQIKQWIFNNHMHHDEDRENCCAERDYPYVNSIKLEKFIEGLYKAKV